MQRLTISIGWLMGVLLWLSGVTEGIQAQAPAEEALRQASVEKPWVNGLGQRFVPVKETPNVWWSIWETRVADYKVFVAETKRAWPAPDFKQAPDHPAVMVNWEDAKAFCAWLSQREQAAGKLPVQARYRLPTDFEWGLAAGFPEGKPEAVGLEQVLYPWGQDWPPPVGVGNYSPELMVDQFAYTSPVGRFVAAANGLYDLGGNVWEWCEDTFNQTADFRILRGASWRMRNPGDLLTACRVGNRPSIRLNGYGFRVVLDWKPATSPTTPVIKP